ncbi:MAG TPA: MmcQ/YjbR family DNA-binding protein [Bryobacteraceae bacterium]
MPKQSVTFNHVRELGLALAEVEEGTMYGSPALKLGGRLLACMAVHKSAEPESLAVRTDFETREALLAEEPGTYYVTHHYVNHPIVLVRLSRIKKDQLRDLLRSAWRFVTAHNKRTRPRGSRPATRS